MESVGTLERRYKGGTDELHGERKGKAIRIIKGNLLDCFYFPKESIIKKDRQSHQGFFFVKTISRHEYEPVFSNSIATWI